MNNRYYKSKYFITKVEGPGFNIWDGGVATQILRITLYLVSQDPAQLADYIMMLYYGMHDITITRPDVRTT